MTTPISREYPVRSTQIVVTKVNGKKESYLPADNVWSWEMTAGFLRVRQTKTSLGVHRTTFIPVKEIKKVEVYEQE